MAPALFTETTTDMRINREEIFGPVAAVIRVKDYDEALAVANDTPYGLSAGIVTTSLKLREPLQAQLDERPGDGEPADGRPRLPRAVRRPEEVAATARASRAATRRTSTRSSRRRIPRLKAYGDVVARSDDSVELLVVAHQRCRRSSSAPLVAAGGCHDRAARASRTHFWSTTGERDRA